MTAPVDPTAVFAWLNEQRLSEPRELHRRLSALESLIPTLEAHMALVDDKLAALSAALDNLTGDVARLAADLAAARDELAQADPALAAKLAPLVERAEALAAVTPEPEAV